MAKLSANGMEFCRLSKEVANINLNGKRYILLSIRSNNVVLRASRVIFADGKQQTSKWKVELTAKSARTIQLGTPELLRAHYTAKGFVQEENARPDGLFGIWNKEPKQ